MIANAGSSNYWARKNADSMQSVAVGVDAIRAVAVLGSTGSIGTQTLEVIEKNRGLFKVDSLSGYSNIALLKEQIRKFSPRAVAVRSELDADEINREFGDAIQVFFGEDACGLMVQAPEVDIVLVAILGFAALPPLLSAIEAGKAIAIANKESLVAAAPLVRRALAKRSSSDAPPFVPVDSEHNSIYQALRARPTETPRRIILTASGGPFLRCKKEELASVTPEQAIKHPRWNMGAKISIDSATLMNKALEVIEASVLFGLPSQKIEVLIHPQSLIHGMVEYSDGSSVAVLYEPNMKVPILNALVECAKLSENEMNLLEESQSGICAASGNSWLQLAEGRSLEFLPVDLQQFPSMALVRVALERGAYYPLIFNGVNEVAVESFMAGEIPFTAVCSLIGHVLENYNVPDDDFEEIELDALLKVESDVRVFAKDVIRAGFAHESNTM